MAAKTTPQKMTQPNTDQKSQKRWQTILFNCDCHDYWEVVEQIILAIGCDQETAARYTYTAHTLGSVAVYKGEKEKCEKVAAILASIGLVVTVVPL